MRAHSQAHRRSQGRFAFPLFTSTIFILLLAESFFFRSVIVSVKVSWLPMPPLLLSPKITVPFISNQAKKRTTFGETTQNGKNNRAIDKFNLDGASGKFVFYVSKSFLLDIVVVAARLFVAIMAKYCTHTAPQCRYNGRFSKGKSLTSDNNVEFHIKSIG